MNDNINSSNTGIRVVKGKSNKNIIEPSVEQDSSEKISTHGRYEYIDTNFFVLISDDGKVRIPLNIEVGEFLIHDGIIASREIDSHTTSFEILGDKVPVPQIFQKNRHENVICGTLQISSYSPHTTRISVYGRKHLAAMAEIAQKIKDMLQKKYNLDLEIPVVLESNNEKITSRYSNFEY